MKAKVVVILINGLFRDKGNNIGAGLVNNAPKDWCYTWHGAFMTINLNTFLNGHISLSRLLCLISGNDRLPPQSVLPWQDNSRACCWPLRHMSDWVARLGVYTMLAFSGEREGEETQVRWKKGKTIIVQAGLHLFSILFHEILSVWNADMQPLSALVCPPPGACWLLNCHPCTRSQLSSSVTRRLDGTPCVQLESVRTWESGVTNSVPD